LERAIHSSLTNTQPLGDLRPGEALCAQRGGLAIKARPDASLGNLLHTEISTQGIRCAYQGYQFLTLKFLLPELVVLFIYPELVIESSIYAALKHIETVTEPTAN